MELTQRTKLLLKGAGALAGTVFLGAIGSGLWELAGRRVVDATWTALEWIASSGSSYILDGLYRRSATAEDGLTPAIFIVVTGLFGMKMWKSTRSLKRSITRDKDLEELRGLTLEERKLRRQALLMKSRRVVRIAHTYLVFWALFMPWILVQEVVIKQFHRAMQQRLVAIAPYVSDDQRRQFASRAVLVEGREDYVALSDEIDALAVAKGLRWSRIKK